MITDYAEAEDRVLLALDRQMNSKDGFETDPDGEIDLLSLTSLVLSALGYQHGSTLTAVQS